MPKHVAAMHKIVRINNRTERLLLQEFSHCIKYCSAVSMFLDDRNFPLALRHTKRQASKHLNTRFVMELNANWGARCCSG